jgi:hypothetical protein
MPQVGTGTCDGKKLWILRQSRKGYGIYESCILGQDAATSHELIFDGDKKTIFIARTLVERDIF